MGQLFKVCPSSVTELPSYLYDSVICGHIFRPPFETTSPSRREGRDKGREGTVPEIVNCSSLLGTAFPHLNVKCNVFAWTTFAIKPRVKHTILHIMRLYEIV